jgi:hypothetical protein
MGKMLYLAMLTLAKARRRRMPTCSHGLIVYVAYRVIKLENPHTDVQAALPIDYVDQIEQESPLIRGN